MHIEVSTKNMGFLESFSTNTRVKIIELLNEKPMNIKDIADELDISSAIVTKHIQKLESAGIVQCESVAGKRGMQKICSLCVKHVTLSFKTKERDENYYFHSIPVGQYLSYSVKPTCGLASTTKYIGMLDDPRYFSDPEHVKASFIWFGNGWVEYRIPNYLLSNQTAKNIQISLEICSEAPFYNERWPSDITFFINNVEIGTWTSPGDFGQTRGIYTPEWWPSRDTQYGLLKTFNISKDGSYVDGVKLSNVSISDLNITFGTDIAFKIANFETSANVGGISIFGKGFGNYNQDIEVMIAY